MEKPKEMPWGYACGVVLGLLVITGLVALLIEVMQQHMQQAQAISRGASWQGQPVGVMEQLNAESAASEGLMPVNAWSISAP